MRAAVVLPTDLLVQHAMPVPTGRALRMVQVFRSAGPGSSQTTPHLHRRAVHSRGTL